MEMLVGLLLGVLIIMGVGLTEINCPRYTPLAIAVTFALFAYSLGYVVLHV